MGPAVYFLLLPVVFALEDNTTMSYLDWNNPTADPVFCSEFNQSETCGGFGYCHEFHCVCDNGHITYPRNAAQAVRAGVPIATIGCAYPVRSRLTAFLLEFFLNLGIGYAVMGWWGLFIGQLILNLCAVSLGFIMSWINKGRDQRRTLVVLLSCLSVTALLLFIWWIIALVQIGGGLIPDAKGAPLSGW
ncbi:hypothetical protein PAPYR_10889 [Paratrimastix pyriformis]|uniref:Uncharacterized protein n=1 Tax=Paratrimastix pyriformis TaxID=342808 RepID=A0ABQ8U4X2_9EUKA|nr:hypothetical protein PAPYR_10889 [Paratrimastix pyriformis]